MAYFLPSRESGAGELMERQGKKSVQKKCCIIHNLLIKGELYMKQLFSSAVVLTAVVFIIGIHGAVAQDKISVEVTATNNASESRTVTFGFAKNATYCIDADTSLREQELPPPPPTEIIDVRFIESRQGSTCLGQGLKYNYHLWNATSVTDTFQIKLQSGSGGFPMTLSWPAGLSQYFSSLSLHDIITGTFINVDMLTNTSFQVTNSAFDKLNIIAVPLANGVEKDNNLLPNKFDLGNNYPNPFNPSTSIKFAIEKTSATTIVVYDILGKKVSTLVSEEMTPGYYTVTWNGTDERGVAVGTGIYYVRMNAVPVNEGQAFTAVQKIMLMK